MNPKCFLPCLSACVLLVFFSGVSLASESDSVPLEITPQGTILVQGMIGDTLKARFVLDTGAGCHMLSWRAFRAAPSLRLGTYTSFQADGVRQDRQLYEIPSLRIGGGVQPAPAVAVWDMLDSSGVDGVISASFFRDRIVTLDFSARRMIFEDSLSFSRRLQDSQIVPVKTRDDRGKSLEVFFDVSAPEGKVLECLFDTGAPTTFDERFLNILKVLEKTQWLGIDEKGDKKLAWSGRLEYISLAWADGVGLNNPTVGFTPAMIYDGRIGWNFFTGRTITFNLPEKYVLIKKQ